MTDGEPREDGEVKADRDSTSVGSVHVEGSLEGPLVIGSHNVIGYTAEQVSLLVAQIKTTFQPAPYDGRSPYKGLDVFEEEDAEIFFGREKLVEELVGRVRGSRTLFVTGPSGSGKSSLLRAGLIHALRQGALQELHSERWLYATMKPGRDPVEALASAFSRLKDPGLGKYFQEHAEEAGALQECAESALSERGDQRLVLLVDQFEEVFTQLPRDKAESFIGLLDYAATVEDGRVILLFAMRSDFISNCAAFPQLNALLNKEFVQIGSMQPEELVSAMAQPALRVGLRIDPDLIAQIINDMKGEPGALPLMQFALKDLFESQRALGGVPALTLKDYFARGGIRQALERHADASFEKLDPQEQELARSVFSGLIEIGRGAQDTRRTALFDELVPAGAAANDVHAVVQKLADARLVTTDEIAGEDRVTISHEKLIDAWPWLRRLVDENRDVIALQNEIAEDAREWEGHGRDPSYLYSGARLANAREKLEAKQLGLSGLAKSFVEAGIKAHQDELEAVEQRAGHLKRQTRILSMALVIALIAVGAAVFFGFQSQRSAADAQSSAAEAYRQSQIALARQLAAQAQSINATRSSEQMAAALIAVQSMKMFPSSEGASMLLNSNLAAPSVGQMAHDDWVQSVAFSPDGRYVVSGGDKTVRVWEAATGEEVARMTHGHRVHSVAFSPDGRYVVSGSADNTARLWEAASGKELARMRHGASVLSVVFSPDGKYVLSASENGTARVWEVASGKEVARMTHGDLVSSVAFSMDSNYVVSGSWDGTARVWDAATGEQVARMTHEGSVRSVAFSPDGRYVVSGSADVTVRVWDAATAEEVARMSHDDSVTSVAISPDGRYVVSGSADGTARVWETATGQETARMNHNEFVDPVTFSPDGRYVVSASSDGTVRVWEVVSGNELARMTHGAWVRSVAFSPDGKYVVSGSEDGTARVWKAASGSEVRMQHSSVLLSVVFSPDGKYVVSASFDGTVRVWEAASGNELTRMIHEGLVRSVAFGPDGRYVVSGGEEGSARVWDVVSGDELARMGHDDSVNSVAFSPDGKYVVSGSADTTARVWDVASGDELARMGHDDSVNSVAFSPDGKYIVSGSNDDTSRVWEVATGQEVARVGHDDSVNSVAFSPDGRYVVSASFDGTARVWEAASGDELTRMSHDSYVYSAAFSPDGKYGVSGSEDGTACIWEIASGSKVACISHGDSVTSVAFSPDGRYVVSGGEDGTARLWEATSGNEVAHLTHGHVVLSVAFSPDGRYVVSGSADTTARVWMWQAQDLILQACEHLPRNLTRAEWELYIGDALPYQAVCENLPIEPEPTATP